jgi:hypothetical protein
MNTCGANTLLRDARVLAEYAARNGQLPANSEVFSRIEALTNKPDPSKETARIAQLCVEIDALCKAIAPVKLARLVWRQTLLAQMRLAVSLVMPFVIGFLTLILTLYLAFQSSQLNQADTALREYQEWAAQKPKEKLYAAFKMYYYERVLNVSEPPLAQLDAYHKLVEDAHELADKGAAIQNLLQNASKILYVPPAVIRLLPATYTNLLKSFNSDDDAEVPVDLPKFPPRAEPANCVPELPAKVKTALKVPYQPTIAMDKYASSWECFLSRIHLQEETLSYPPWPAIYDTRLKVNLLVTWLLPGLYGLLGACVFLMRHLVMSHDRRYVRETSMLREFAILLRIALGGLAGIIIGWFWVPAGAGGGSAALPISSIPFGIAFLAGFSIDMLFSLLDRLNRSVGKPAPSPK